MGIICAQAGSRLAAVLNRVRQVWRFLPPAPPTLHCNSPVAAGGEGTWLVFKRKASRKAVHATRLWLQVEKDRALFCKGINV